MDSAAPRLKAPFPAFGGKSAIAAMAWSRLGSVRNFIEPFAFSAAMLLLRPDEPQIETINDLNSYVSNFWRAVKHDPEAVADHADWPVNEVDLHARHKWLVNSEHANKALAQVRHDPDFYDAKIAGWWCWGACMWIGSGWCDTQQLPHISNAGQGVNGLTQKLPHMDPTRGIIGQRPDAETWQQRPQLEDSGGRGVFTDVYIKRPLLTNNGGGAGIHAPGSTKRPQLCNGNTTAGPGILAHVPDDHRPQLADAYSRGRGVHGNDTLTDCERRRLWLKDWFIRLSDRLRAVRVCCGHWARVCDSDSTLTRLGTTGVFLDPPYRKTLACGKQNRAAHIYANDKHQDVGALVDEVQDWCLRWGDDREMRIAVCGLEGEYPKLDDASWEKVPWKSRGGYGNRTERGKENAARERIWLSRHCVPATGVPTLFDGTEAA